MDMIFAHMPFRYLYLIGPADLAHQFAHPRPNRPAQHRRRYMVIQTKRYLRAYFVWLGRPIDLHMDLLPQDLT